MFYILIVIVMLGCPLRCSSQPRTPYITQSTCQCLSYLSADILACLFGTFGEKLTASRKTLFTDCYLLVPTILTILTLTSYSKYNGIVTNIRVIKSGGVIIAATSIITINACFLYFARR